MATSAELRSVLFRAREYIESESYLDADDKAGRRDATLREIHEVLADKPKEG